MKSKSMSAHGSSTLAWVCRCSRGLSSALSPAIHILAGLNVCIQAMTPITRSSLLAASMTRRISSGWVSTGFQATLTGTDDAASSAPAICADCPATWRSVSGP